MKNQTFYFETENGNYFLFQTNKKVNICGPGYYVNQNMEIFSDGLRHNAQDEVTWAEKEFNPKIQKASLEMHEKFLEILKENSPELQNMYGERFGSHNPFASNPVLQALLKK